jgi:hypothetical protein
MLRSALALWAVVLVLAVAVVVLHVIGWLLVTAAVSGAAYALGRRKGKTPARGQGRARTGRQPARGTMAYPPAAGTSPAVSGLPVSERDDLRRQVAKLEDDAGRHDELIEQLEAVTGRPVEAVIASYRQAQRIYGPAATGKKGAAGQ